MVKSDLRHASRKRTTYVLIHGAGDVGWYWHLVDAQLQERGHDVVTMDLPVDDESAGLAHQHFHPVVIAVARSHRDAKRTKTSVPR